MRRRPRRVAWPACPTCGKAYDAAYSVAGHRWYACRACWMGKNGNYLAHPGLPGVLPVVVKGAWVSEVVA